MEIVAFLGTGGIVAIVVAGLPVSGLRVIQEYERRLEKS